MKLKIFLFLFVFTTLLFSQEQKYLNNDTRLYTKANSDSEFIGFFKVNAQVQLISKYNDNWYFVKADNNNTGYVLTKYLSDKYTSNPTEAEDKENPILRGDQYYGSYHMFINVASLRARGLPNATGPIVSALTTGEAVPVKYIPLDEDDWVFISSGRYIQKKYLGERPVFSELLNLFDSFETDNINDRKKIAERLVQLAWNGETENLPQAYNIYYNVAKQLKDIALIEDIETKLILVNGLTTKKPYQETEAFIENADFIIRGVNVENHFIKLNELVKVYGEPTKIDLISDECGVYYSETFYTYPNMVLSVNKEENLADLYTVFINPNNSFKIDDDHIITHNTSERDFLIKYAQHIFTGIANLHIYTIQTDSGGYNFTFKNGKIVSIDFYNLC